MGKGKISSKDKKKYKNTIPVFRLNPELKKSECVVQHVGYFNKGDTLNDEVIEIETSDSMIDVYGKNVYYYGEIMGYDVKAKIGKCNMLGPYVISNGKLPLYDLTFDYSKNILKGHLFNVYINFTIDPECRKGLKTPAAYVNATLKGKLSMDLDCDPALMEKKDLIIERVKENTMKLIVLEYSDRDIDLLQDEIISKLEDENKKITKFFNNLFDGVSIANFPSEKIILSMYLIPIYKSPYLVEFFKEAFVLREKERREKAGIDDDFFCPPKRKAIKIKDIMDNPDLVDKYLGLTDD